METKTKTEALNLEAAQGSAFYAVAGVQKDGSLQEIGGEGRTWRTLEDFHRERGWRAGTVVTYYPADLSGQGGDGSAR